MSAQAPAHKQAGGKAGVLAGPGAVGWARWLGVGAWAPASAPPLTAWPCDLGQAPCPVWPTVSHLYHEAVEQHSLHAGCGF